MGWSVAEGLVSPLSGLATALGGLRSNLRGYQRQCQPSDHKTKYRWHFDFP
jgi:hypothetical protein